MKTIEQDLQLRAYLAHRGLTSEETHWAIGIIEAMQSKAASLIAMQAPNMINVIKSMRALDPVDPENFKFNIKADVASSSFDSCGADFTLSFSQKFKSVDGVLFDPQEGLEEQPEMLFGAEKKDD